MTLGTAPATAFISGFWAGSVAAWAATAITAPRQAAIQAMKGACLAGQVGFFMMVSLVHAGLGSMVMRCFRMKRGFISSSRWRQRRWRRLSRP